MSADLTDDELTMVEDVVRDAGSPLHETQAGNWLAAKAGPMVAEVRQSRERIKALEFRLTLAKSSVGSVPTREHVRWIQATSNLSAALDDVLDSVGHHLGRSQREAARSVLNDADKLVSSSALPPTEGVKP